MMSLAFVESQGLTQEPALDHSQSCAMLNLDEGVTLDATEVIHAHDQVYEIRNDDGRDDPGIVDDHACAGDQAVPARHQLFGIGEHR